MKVTTSVSERSSHYGSRIPEFLVIVVNFSDRDDPWILPSGIGLDRSVGDVPVENSPNERGDQRNSRLRASHSLAEAEEECQVAVDPMLLFQFPNYHLHLSTAVKS